MTRNKFKNNNWSLQDIVNSYKKENPHWTEKKCLNQAKLIYRELNKLNKNEHRSNAKYYSNTIADSNIGYDLYKDEEY